MNTIAGYSHEQGLTKRRWTADDLFISMFQGRKRGDECGFDGARQRADSDDTRGSTMTMGLGFPDKKVMAELTAKMLLEVEAVRFMDDKPFIFTSGWASPVYTDCRRLISFPRVRQTLIDFGAATVFRDAGFEQFDTVVGGETAGIPFAAWMADRLMLPMQYVRKKPKGFGRNAQIEGHLEPGQRVLLVEDLTTDGGSKVNFCNALRAAGATVEHIFVIFFYGIYPEERENPRPTSTSSCTICAPGGTCWNSPRPAASSIRSSSTRSRSSCTIRPAGRRRMAASRRPPPSNELTSSEYERMEFDNSFEVPLPPEQAWPVLMNIQGIAPCMPGAQLTEVVDDKTYKGNIAVRLGPVALTFAGLVKFEEIDNANHTARVKAQGTDAKGRGSAQAAATFRLEPRPPAPRCWCTPTSRCRARSRNTAAASA